MAFASMAEPRVENSAQVSSCWLKFVHDDSQVFYMSLSSTLYAAQRGGMQLGM